jgi:hypothetical protein
MAGGRPAEPVDARIYDDILWLLERYGLRVSAAREAGHHTHRDGTAVDLVPAAGGTQDDCDAPRPGAWRAISDGYRALVPPVRARRAR